MRVISLVLLGLLSCNNPTTTTDATGLSSDSTRGNNVSPSIKPDIKEDSIDTDHLDQPESELLQLSDLGLQSMYQKALRQWSNQKKEKGEKRKVHFVADNNRMNSDDVLDNAISFYFEKHGDGFQDGAQYDSLILSHIIELYNIELSQLIQIIKRLETVSNPTMKPPSFNLFGTRGDTEPENELRFYSLLSAAIDAFAGNLNDVSIDFKGSEKKLWQILRDELMGEAVMGEKGRKRFNLLPITAFVNNIIVHDQYKIVFSEMIAEIDSHIPNVQHELSKEDATVLMSDFDFIKHTLASLIEIGAQPTVVEYFLNLEINGNKLMRNLNSEEVFWQMAKSDYKIDIDILSKILPYLISSEVLFSNKKKKNILAEQILVRLINGIDNEIWNINMFRQIYETKVSDKDRYKKMYILDKLLPVFIKQDPITEGSLMKLQIYVVNKDLQLLMITVKDYLLEIKDDVTDDKVKAHYLKIVEIINYIIDNQGSLTDDQMWPHLSKYIN